MLKCQQRDIHFSLVPGACELQVGSSSCEQPGPRKHA